MISHTEYEEMLARVAANGSVREAAKPVLTGEPKRSKFNVAAPPDRTVDGIRFDSKKEMETYLKLKFLVDGGAITDLKLQPVFLLQDKFRKGGKTHRAVTYKADFSFVERGRLRIIDTKGVKTPMFRLKSKLFEKAFPDLSIECW